MPLVINDSENYIDGIVKMNNRIFKVLAYADDLVLLATNKLS